MGMGNPHGSWVRVLAGMGAGQDFETHDLLDTHHFHICPHILPPSSPPTHFIHHWRGRALQ
ncbi:hypothetical protein BDR03DRAFT_1019076 [Suillus americanus]|nr:hypothetical protein BDR03DRAFT_1019076 [Suillus americanus]